MIVELDLLGSYSEVMHLAILPSCQQVLCVRVLGGRVVVMENFVSLPKEFTRGSGTIGLSS